MRVKIEQVGSGIHPSEVVVAIQTADGPERVVVDRRSIERNSLEVGYPIDKRDQRLLVELPRETTTGTWRVWVDADKLIAGEMIAAE